MRKIVCLVLISSMCLTACGSKDGIIVESADTVNRIEISSENDNHTLSNIDTSIDGVDFKLYSKYRDTIDSDKWRMLESTTGIDNEDYLMPCSNSGSLYIDTVNFVCDDYSKGVSLNLQFTNSNKDKDTPLKDCIVTRIGVSTNFVNRDKDYKLPKVTINGAVTLEDSFEHCKEVLGKPDYEDESSSFSHLIYKGSNDISLILEFEGDYGLVGFDLAGTNNS